MLPWLLILLLLLVCALAAAFYYWQTRMNIPQLGYTLLPLYDIPDVILIGGVVIENRGRQPAPQIRITIQFASEAPTMIHHLQVISADNAVLRSGGERHSFATLSARSLRPRGKIFVYWATAHPLQPRITLTSYAPDQASLRQKFFPHKASQ